MTHDVHDLLDDAAPVPTRTVDLDGVLGMARRRKRRVRAAGALAGAVVIAAAAVGTVAVTSGNGGSTSLAVRAGSPASSIPDGWTRVTVDGAGVSIAIPSGWHQVTPQPGTNNLLVVGTPTKQSEGPAAACVPAADYPSDIVGTWVSLFEYAPGSSGAPTANSVMPRPADFRSEGNDCNPAASPNGYVRFEFSDADRVFIARIATIGSADAANDIKLAEQVLNTLHVDPPAGDATTTTSVPDASTTAPAGTDNGPVTTTLPPSAVGESADQLAIRNAFLGWLGTPQRDQVDEFVEDLASIRDAVRQGMAQHTPQDLAGFGGRVESVVIADPTHADVVYTVLHDGAPLYANRPGKAVKVGGTWKVTRDTECALLAVGGVTCPARTTPTP